MFIVPFIYKITTENNINVHSITILTVGGKQLWEETDKTLKLDRDILEPNEIYRRAPAFSINKDANKVEFCEVDTEKTRIADFYKWSELSLADTETFCWRTFTHLLGQSGECWLTAPKQEKLGKYDIDKLIKTIVEKKSSKP